MEPPAQSQQSKLAKLKSMLYNKDTKTILGRGCLAWAQISLFYCLFYAFLAAFFIGMLLVVKALTPKDHPQYVLGESAMATIYSLNPGVGFRPQPDVSSDSIVFSPNNSQKFSFEAYVGNIDSYLDQYYRLPEEAPESCPPGQAPSAPGKSCGFVIESAGECSSASQYGFPSGRPCVLVKLNRLYGWKSGGMPRCPKEGEFGNGKGNLGSEGDIRVMCSGEMASDRDNIRSIRYFSYNGESNECGSIPNSPSYFPFLSQPTYQSPYVFAQFDISPNTVVSILCRAYADNIDNETKMPMRGMTRIKILRVQQQSEQNSAENKQNEL